MKLFTSRHTLIAAIIVALACFCSCGDSSSVDKSLDNAETALSDNDYKGAAKLAEKLSTSGEPGYLSARQSARLSIIYMQLADHDNEDTNTAIAVNYCREAIKENPDSAEEYYSQLPADQLGYVRTLMALVQNINNPGKIPSDSIASDSIE